MIKAQWQLHDSKERYGSVSRFLHWSMALVLTWQFTTALAHLLAHDTPVEEFLWGTHKTVGLLLLILVVIRGLWSVYNRGHRPPSLNIMAKIGHFTLYALTVFIPLIALLRQYGSGRAFSPLGVPLMPGFEGEKINWMMAPANLFHSWLGWLLLILIIGHIVMVFVHRSRGVDEDVLARMLGNRER